MDEDTKCKPVASRQPSGPLESPSNWLGLETYSIKKELPATMQHWSCTSNHINAATLLQPKKQCTVPVAVPNCVFCATRHATDRCTKAVGHLMLIAFYFLLRVGEHQPRKRTTQDTRFLFEICEVICRQSRDCTQASTSVCKKNWYSFIINWQSKEWMPRRHIVTPCIERQRKLLSPGLLLWWKIRHNQKPHYAHFATPHHCPGSM